MTLECTGSQDLLENLKADELLTANASAKQGLEEMSLLFTLLKAYRVFDKVPRLFHFGDSAISYELP